MRLLGITLSVLITIASATDVAIILVGSRYRLTENRINEHRRSIQKDCEMEKISCSVYDALNEFSSELQGMWTMIPAILKLPTAPEWLIIAEDTSEINIRNLKNFTSQKISTDLVFSGFGLKDREPTIIHHFGMNAPDNFLYPLLSAGFILSKSVVEKIQKIDKNERWSGFAIDAKYEFALLLHKWFELHLEHNPELFCAHEQSGSFCITKSPSFSNQLSVPDDDIQVMIKTFGGHHKSRIPVLKHTWTRGISNIEYCSDTVDPEIPSIDMGVENTERGHCGKTWAIFRRFLEKSRTNWLVVADDDTLMSWTRMKKMLADYDLSDRVIIGERYGFGFSMDGGSGYDYPTGGSGMIFTRSAVQSLLATCPLCASDSDPDDMTIGMCAVNARIPIIHEPRLHQARPQDYAPEYLYSPISFHKYTEIDPMMVFHYYLVDEDDYTKTEL